MARIYEVRNPVITDRFLTTIVGLQPVAGQGQLTFDATWSPYCQGTIVCAPPSAADLTKIDPRQGVRLSATLRQTDTDTGAVIVKPLQLAVRSRSRAYVRGPGEVLTLTVASDESLAQDWADPAGLGPGSNDAASQFLLYALNKVFPEQNSVGTFTVEQGAPNGSVSSASTWDGGTPAWDYMSAIAEAAGAWLYCDELRNWHLAAPGWSPDTSSKTYSGSSHIIDVTDTIDRADPAFGNFAIVTYTGDNPASMVSSDGGVLPRKTITVSRARKQPAGNAATRIRSTAQKRGRSLIINALAEIDVRPNMTRQASFQGVSWSGLVQSVALDLAQGTMNLKLNVIES